MIFALLRRHLTRRSYVTAISPWQRAPRYFNQHPLRDWFQSALKQTEEVVKGDNFNVVFLGTGAGTPSNERYNSATLLDFGGQSYLFDAGEGVQHRLMLCRTDFKSIRRIFISHLHGDHIFGLPGLLLQLNTDDETQRQIDVYGPPGLFNYVTACLLACGMGRVKRKMVVHELVGGSEDPGPSVHSAPHFRHVGYPELSKDGFEKRYIPRNKDGTWTLQTPEFVIEEKQPHQSRQRQSNDVHSGTTRQFHVRAAEVLHDRNMQTFAFCVKEPKPPISLDVKKARALGVQPSHKYQDLKNGISVETDDGTAIVTPEDVRDHLKEIVPRKLVVCGDNCQWSRELYYLARNADILVHEATLPESMASQIYHRKHSTAKMAGKLAKDVNARLLAITHLGGRNNMTNPEEHWLAQEANGGVSDVVVAQDFLEIVVPLRRGADLARPKSASAPQDSPVQ